MKTKIPYYFYPLCQIICFIFPNYGIASELRIHPEKENSPTMLATVYAIRINGVAIYDNYQYTDNEVSFDGGFNLQIDFASTPRPGQIFVLWSNTTFVDYAMVPDGPYHITTFSKYYSLDKFPEGESTFSISADARYSFIFILESDKPNQGTRSGRARRSKRDRRFGKEDFSSIEDLSSRNSLKISPNPADQFVVVEIPEKDASPVLLYNSRGQLLTIPFKVKVLDQHQKINLDTRLLPAGWYFLQSQGTDKTYTGLFQKN